MQSNFTLNDGIFILESFGCYVKVEGGIIYTAAINSDDSCNYDWSEVTDPDPKFIEAVRYHG